MRKVTREIVSAFMNHETKRVSNSYTDGTALYLHDNEIAVHVKGGIEVSNAGWFSNTTKERLNGLPGVRVYQKNHQWYLNDEPWDGGWKFIEL